MDTLGMMMQWEQGELDDKGTILLFQELMDTGLLWNLQGCYHRFAKYLVQEGLIKVREL